MSEQYRTQSAGMIVGGLSPIAPQNRNPIAQEPPPPTLEEVYAGRRGLQFSEAVTGQQNPFGDEWSRQKSYRTESNMLAGMYADPEKLGGLAPEVLDLADASYDPKVFKEMAVNWRATAFLLDTPVDSLKDSDYLLYKKLVAAKLGKPAPKTETEYHSMLGEHFGKQQEMDAAIDELNMAAVVDALNATNYGTNFPMVRDQGRTISAWMEKYPELATPDRQWLLARSAGEMYQQTLNDLADVREYAAPTYKTLVAFTRGEATEEQIDELGRNLQDLTPEQFNKVGQYVTLAAEAEQIDRGAWTQLAKNLGESLSRGFDFIPAGDLQYGQAEAENRLNSVQNDEVWVPVETDNLPPGRYQNPRTAQGLPQYLQMAAFGESPDIGQEGGPAWRKATPEEKEQIKSNAEEGIKAITMVRKLRNLAKTGVDPIRPLSQGGLIGAAERGMYGLAGSIPLMGAVGLNPFLGVFAYQQQEFDRIMLENEGMSVKAAQGLAVVEGGMNAVIDRFQISSLMGKSKMLGGVMAGMKGKGVLNYLGRTGVIQAEQFLQEGAQDLIAPVVETIASALRADMPDKDFMSELGKWWETRPEVFFAVLPLALIGGGFASTGDLRNVNTEVTRERLRGAGFSEEKITEIMASTTRAELDARIQLAWQNRTEEDKARGLAYLNEQLKQSKRTELDHYLAVERKEDGTTEFVVNDYTGQEVGRFADFDAAIEVISQNVSSNLTNEKNTTADFLNWATKVLQNPDISTDQKPVSVAQELERMQGIGDQKGIDNLMARLKFGDLQGKDPNKLYILGETTIEQVRDGVYRAVIKLKENASPRDALEEVNHGFFKVALANGTYTLDTYQKWLEQTEAATGRELKRATEMEVIESLAQVTEDYLMGKVDETSMPQSFVDYIKRIAAVFKEALARFLKMDEAFKTGAIDTDFQTALEQSLGIDPQVRLDRVRDQTAASVDPTAAETDPSYSIRSVEHFKNDTRFDKLVKDGRVFIGRDIEDFKGMHILLHSPDNAFAGTIKLTDGSEIQGKGGVYYPALYADKNYFWASTEAMVMRTAKHLNEIGDKNGGKILMGLVSAPVEKLFSSTSMSTGVVKFLKALASDPKGGLSEAELNSMLVTASKVEFIKPGNPPKKFKFTLKENDSFKKNFSQIDKLLEPTGSIFEVRKQFVVSLVDQLTRHYKDKPENSEYVAGILTDAENKYAKSAIKKGKLSKASIMQGLGNLLTEPFLRDFQDFGNGKIYAVLEVDGKVDGIPTTEHDSYPATIVPQNKKQKVKLHVLKEAVDWQDVVGKETGQYTTKEERLNLMPTSGMSATTLKVLGVKSGSAANALNYSVRETKKSAKEIEKIVAAMSASDIRAKLESSKLTPTPRMVAMLGEFPQYLEPIVQYMMEKRQDLVDGNVSPRDVAKAYWMTIASIGADAIDVSTIAAKAQAEGIAFNPDPMFTTTGTRGQLQMRPEELAAYWLGTPEGQRALDNVEKGIFNANDWETGLLLRDAFGRNDLRERWRVTGKGTPNTEATIVVDGAAVQVEVNEKGNWSFSIDNQTTPVELPDGMTEGKRVQTSGSVGLPKGKKANLTNLKELTDRINAAKGNPDKLEKAVMSAVGIGEGKKGFVSHFLGFGGWSTIDAVELNMWLAGVGDTTRATQDQKMIAAIAKKASGQTATRRDLFERIRKAILGLRTKAKGGDKIPKEVAPHIIHHWIWDAAKDIQTTHEGLYFAMQNYSVREQGDSDFAERIAATALIDKDNQILSSPSKTHAELMEESGFDLDGGEFPPSQNFGFVTTTGRFVLQDEAQRIAQEARQVQGNQPISGEIVSRLNDDPSYSIREDVAQISPEQDILNERMKNIPPHSVEIRNLYGNTEISIYGSDDLSTPKVTALVTTRENSIHIDTIEASSSGKGQGYGKAIYLYIARLAQNNFKEYITGSSSEEAIGVRKSLFPTITEQQDDLTFSKSEISSNLNYTPQSFFDSYDDAGNVIALSEQGIEGLKSRLPSARSAGGTQGVGGTGESDPAFSIREQSEIDRVAAAVDAVNRGPEGRLAVYQRAKARFLQLMQDNKDALDAIKAAAVTDPAPAIEKLEEDRAGRLADIETEEIAEVESALQDNAVQFATRIDEAIDPEDKATLKADARDRAKILEKGIREKYAERKKQVEQEIAAEKRKVSEVSEARRVAANAVYKEKVRSEKLAQAIAELDGLLKVLPKEVIGKVGGFATLARIGTGDKALADFFVKRVEMVDEQLERYLNKEYDEELDRIFERAKPKKAKAGEKPKGIGAEIQNLFAVLQEARGWNAREVSAHLASIDDQIASGDLTAEQEAALKQEAALVTLVGNWKPKYQGYTDPTTGKTGYMKVDNGADSNRRAAAVAALRETWARGFAEYRAREIAKRQQRESDQQQAILATGKKGDINKRKEKQLADAGLVAKFRNALFNLVSWDQFTGLLFGNNSAVANRVSDLQRRADNQKEDAIQFKVEAIESLFTRLAGGNRLDGEKLRWDMSQMSMKVDGLPLSELEGLTATMMWMQADGKRHMEGRFDENGNRISAWGYTQAFIDKIEGALSNEAKEVRQFLLDNYDREYQRINAVYRQLNGIDLPRIQFYSPLLVAPQNAPQGMINDPVTGNAISAASTSPGALRTRGNAVAEPQFRDALQTFIAHTKQMEHWMAYAPILAEVNGVLRNREVQSAIQEKGGIEATKVLNLWLDLFAQGGNRDASNQLDLSQQITGMAGRGAQMALVGRLGTLLIQSTQLGAAIAEMPTGSYVVRLSKLLTGNLGWGEALNSPYVQRRIREMPPVVQQALEGLAATQPNRLKYEVARIGRLISGTDGLMTAGTFAIVFDYHFTQAKKMGFGEADARAYARNVAERATDRIAQPTRMGARSIFEITQTNAYAKVGWAFASEARKNLALAAYAVANRPAGDAARTIGGLLFLNILFGSLIRNAWRDARDEEDDEWFDDRNWSGKRLLLSAFTEPFYGLPFIGAAIEEGAYAAAGEYNMAGNVLSPVRAIRALRNLPETLSGEREVEDMLKDLNGVMWVMGLFNQNLAAATSLSNIAVDAFSLGKNAKENLEE